MDEVVEVSKAAAERGKMALAKVAHFVPRIKSYDEMVTWYKAVFEAEVMAATRALQAAASASRGPNFKPTLYPLTCRDLP